MVPGEVARKRFYDPVADFARLQQTADCQTVFIQGFQFRQVAACSCFGLLALGNVCRNACYSFYPACLIKNWEGAVPDPAHRPIGTRDAIFYFRFFPFLSFSRACDTTGRSSGRILFMNASGSPIRNSREHPHTSLSGWAHVYFFAAFNIGHPKYFLNIIRQLNEALFRGT